VTLPATAPTTGPIALRHFRFFYPYTDNERSNRYWREIDRQHWEERYEISGRKTQFRVIARVLDGDHSGIIVRRLPDEDIELLIRPNPGEWVEIRNTGEQAWRRLVQVQAGE
jgi:hypothetical protein